MTPHFTPSPPQGHWSYFQLCPPRINATVNIPEWEHSEVELQGRRVSFDFPGTFQSLQTEFQLLHVGRLLALFSLYVAIDVKSFIYVLQAVSLWPGRVSPFPPWAVALSVADTGRRKGLFEQGVTTPANIQPPSFKSDNETRAEPESQALPARQGLQGKNRGSRREGWAAEGVRELSSNQTLAVRWAPTQSPSWDLTPFTPSTRAESRVVVVLVSGEVWDRGPGVWLEASPGSGHWTLGPCREDFSSLTFHSIVRNHTFEPAVLISEPTCSVEKENLSSCPGNFVFISVS